MLLSKFKRLMNWTHHNQRNIETGKTVLLWVLVVSSLLLTWSLWTYNPALDPLKEQGAVESIKIEPTKGSRKLSEVIRPIQLIYLEDGQNYFAISDNDVRQNLYNKLLESIMINPNDVKPSEINGKIDPDNFIEFVYPTNLSRDIVEHIFNLKNRQLFISDFDRVYLFQKDMNEVKKNYLRLISYGENSYVDLEVQLDYQYFKEKMENKNISKQYFNHIIKNENGTTSDVIYLPAEKEVINHPIMVVQKIAPEDFKVALFNDPSSVNREDSNNKIYYSDDKQVLSISTESNEMSYRSFVTDIGEQIPDFERVKKSIDFVNNHYGWTNQYVLFGEHNDVNKTFRLIVDGIPVLNNLGTIQIRWEKGQIYEYNRSLIKFSYEYQRNIYTENMKENDPKKWPSLMSGYEVLNILEETNKLSTVKDIKIGYNMHKYNNNSSFYEFTPKWYYFNGEYWNPIESLVRRDLDGLEKN